MARAILDVDINDTKFQKFKKDFESYQSAVAKTPNAWKGVNKEVRDAEARLRQSAQTMNQHLESARKIAKVQSSLSTMTGSVAKDWDRISTRSRSFAGHITGAVRGIGRLLGLTSVFGTLFGIGGIMSLDRLAANAANARRSTTGLGVSYGEQQAFNNTFGRAVDGGAFMGGISQAKGNLASSQAAALYMLGMNPSSGSTADTAVEALNRIRQRALQTPEEHLGILAQTHNLGDLGLGVEDLRRLKGMSGQEFEQYSAEYRKKRGDLNVDDPTLKKWQDFNAALDVAGTKIKNVLIDGLVPLLPPLTKLSEAFTDMVRDILGSQGVKDAMNWAATALKDFGKYLGDGDFKRDLKEVISGISQMARAIKRGLDLLGITTGAGTSAPSKSDFDAQTEAILRDRGYMYPTEEAKNKFRAMRENDYKSQYGGGNQSNTTAITGITLPTSASGQNPYNFRNPGSLMDPRSTPGNYIPLQFNSEEEGLRAQADLLRKYQNLKGNNTLRDIVFGNQRHPGYVGPENNGRDREIYLRNVAQWTGFDPDKKLDLNDPAVLAQVMAAFNRQEGHQRRHQTPDQIRVVIENNTGGNSIAQVNQMGVPQ